MIIDYKDLHRYDDINEILANKNITSLFRFIPFNDNECLNELKLNTLKNNQEHVSSPLKFNDPYDCELSFNLMDGIDDFLKIGFNREARRDIKHNEKKKKSIEKGTCYLQGELTSKWNEIKQQIAVCSLSEHVDNFLMWSHYANCYRGICIEYGLSEIDNILLPVIYTDKLIRARDFMTKEEFRKNSLNGLFEAAIRAVISKHSQWSYENEWRIVKPLDKNDADYVKMPVPKNIYIGFKIDDKIRAKIIDISVKLGIVGIYNTQICSNEYKLIHEPIK